MCIHIYIYSYVSRVYISDISKMQFFTVNILTISKYLFLNAQICFQEKMFTIFLIWTRHTPVLFASAVPLNIITVKKKKKKRSADRKGPFWSTLIVGNKNPSNGNFKVCGFSLLCNCHCVLIAQISLRKPVTSLLKPALLGRKSGKSPAAGNKTYHVVQVLKLPNIKLSYWINLIN